MAEATIKIDGMEINVKSEIFSERFMKLVKTIETFDQNKNNNSTLTANSIPKKTNQTKVKQTTQKINVIPYLADIDVKNNVERILNLAKKYKIEEYYNEKIEDITPYLNTYKHGCGFTDCYAREFLKSILTKCFEFAETDFYKNQNPKE